MTDDTDLALLYLAEKFMPAEQSIIGVMIASLAARPWPGVQIAVDWREFLGCTEDDITDALRARYRREAERLEREARECATTAGQDIAALMRDWLASGHARDFFRERAAAQWAKIKAA